MRSSTTGKGRSIGSACSSTRIRRFARRVSIFPLPYPPLLYSTRRAFESEASFPVLLVTLLAGSIRAIGAGVSSRRKRPRNPPLFFFSAVASPAEGCCGGGAHSSAREGTARIVGGSRCGAGAGAPHGSAFAGASFGLALGAHAFAGVSVEAGGGVVHDSAGLPPPGARHQSFGSPGGGFAAGAGACGCAAFAAGPGANRPESDDSRSSTAGGTSTPGAGGSGTGPNPPMRCAISLCRSSRISGGGGVDPGAAAASAGAAQSGLLVFHS